MREERGGGAVALVLEGLAFRFEGGPFLGDVEPLLIEFVPLGFEHTALPDAHAKPGAAPPNRFYMYGVVARLGLLAASVELEKTDPEAIQV